MIRIVLYFFGLLAIFLIGTWTQILRQENRDLQNKVAALKRELATQKSAYDKLYDDDLKERSLVREKSATDQNELHAARQRLADLRQALAALQQQAPAAMDDSADSHIQDDKLAIKTLEAQLAELNNENHAVSARSENYRVQQKQQINSQATELDGQMRAIDEALRVNNADIQGVNKRDPDRAAKIARLNDQRAALKIARQQNRAERQSLKVADSNTATAVSREVSQENNEIGNDRTNVQRQLADRKAELDHWQKSKAAQSDVQRARSEKIKRVQQDVAEQSQKVKALEASACVAPGL